LLLIITSTSDDLSGETNTDDLELGGFSEFFAISGCNTHFNSKLRRNHSR